MIEQKIIPFLWFEKEAGKVAKFYTSVFKGSKIKNTTTLQNTPSGTVEIVTIELLGQEFTILVAGPLFKFTPEGRTVWLAQGQIRPLMANRPHCFEQDAARQ